MRAGRLIPGQRLVEADLTHKLGVSRGSVREALSRLTAEGVVTLNRHRGAFVRVLTREEVQDVLVVFEAMTGLVVKLAVRNIGEAGNSASFKREYHKLIAFRDREDSIAFLAQRRAFYDALIRIGGNRELGRIMPLMQVHLLRMQFQSYVTSHQREEQFQEYEAVSRAVLDGDQKRAERFMKFHINRTRIVFGHLPDEAFSLRYP
jgi:DNA-binding GntR family transcriptional regulator